MQRQALDVLWLTLERADGATSRMGVTSEHPLFMVGEGWIDAGSLAPGDLIRDRDLNALTILSVEADTRPQMVYNLEIAEAHTYFAGELEVWSHNAKSTTSGNSPSAQTGREKHCELGGFLGEGWETEVDLGDAGRADAVNFGSGEVVELKPRSRRRRDYNQLDRYLCALREKFPDQKWIGIIMRYK